MSVGLLLLAHDGIGTALLETAMAALGGPPPLRVETLSASRDCDPDCVLKEAQASVARLDEGDGVLVLTDLFGSTPSNIATRLGATGRVRIVSGMNLPMLIRVLNYPQLPLDQLVLKAVTGARDGVIDVLGERYEG
jgi:PTS system ascorbate-specific IIA component